MEKNKKKGGLAIAWFATCAGGLLISLTGIGAFIWIPAIIVGLILAIVALANKQKYKGLSISAILIGVLTIVWLWIFLSKAKQFISPVLQSVQEIQTLVENDPELKELFEDEEFKKTFEINFEKRVEARKDGLESSIEWENGGVNFTMLSSEMADIISEETKAAIEETKEQLNK